MNTYAIAAFKVLKLKLYS